MLSNRFMDDHKAAIELSELQINTRNSVLKKILSNYYQMEEVYCICGSNDYRILAEKDRFGLPVRTVICMNCGLVRTNPRMTQHSYNEFYKEEYRKLYNTETLPVNFFCYQAARGQYIIDFLKATGIACAGKVLEIGCGAGGILESFKKDGWEVTGVDLGEDYINYGQRKGLNLIVGNSEMLIEKYAGYFDLIILSHVFEHFLDITKELAVVAKLLKEEGCLYLEVPGIKSLRNNPDFLVYLQNAHTYHFVLNTLRQILNNNGFALISGDEGIHSVFKKSNVLSRNCKNYYNEVMNYLVDLEERPEVYRQRDIMERTQNLEKIQLNRFTELQKQIQKYPDQSVVLYGTEKHTQLLVSFLGNNPKVFGLTDDDPRKFGQTYLNYQIYDLNQIVDQVKAVVISSYDSQEIIDERIKNYANSQFDVVRIYKECDYYYW